MVRQRYFQPELLILKKVKPKRTLLFRIKIRLFFKIFLFFTVKNRIIFTPVHIDEKSLRFNPCFFNL